jgi:ferredoxin-type protein NapG
MGKATQRYVRGWDTRDEERLQGISTDVTTETKASEKKAMDYLNEDDLLAEE